MLGLEAKACRILSSTSSVTVQPPKPARSKGDAAVQPAGGAASAQGSGGPQPKTLHTHIEEALELLAILKPFL